jgi:hypothetical protein
VESDPPAGGLKVNVSNIILNTNTIIFNFKLSTLKFLDVLSITILEECFGLQESISLLKEINIDLTLNIIY